MKPAKMRRVEDCGMVLCSSKEEARGLNPGSVAIAPYTPFNVILDCAAAAHFDIGCGMRTAQQGSVD